MIVNNIHLTIPGTSGASSLNEGFRIRGFSCPYDQLTAGERGAPNAYSRLCCYNLEASESLCVLGALWDAKVRFFFRYVFFLYFHFFRDGVCLMFIFFFYFSFMRDGSFGVFKALHRFLEICFRFRSFKCSDFLKHLRGVCYKLHYSCFGIYHYENYISYFFGIILSFCYLSYTL